MTPSHAHRRDIITIFMQSRRIVITGMGWITPLGFDLDTVWSRLMRGESGVSKIDRFDAATFPTTFAAQIRDYDYNKYVRPWPFALGTSGE